MAEEKVTSAAASVSLGMTVVALYVVFVGAVALGFSSYIYRAAWETDFRAFPAAAGSEAIAPNERSLDSMIFILQREDALQEAIAGVEGVIRDLRADAVEVRAAVNMSFGPIARAREQMRVYVGFAIIDLEPYRLLLDPASQSKFAQALADEDLGPHGRLTALLDLTEQGLGAPGITDDQRVAFGEFKEGAAARLDAFLAEIESANANSHRVQQERQAVTDRIAAQEAVLAQYRGEMAALEEILPINSVTRAQLASLRTETLFLPDDLLVKLVSFPTIFLTLIVTIASGGLGTVVSFSRRYYSGHDPGLNRARLFVNVGEGIAAAIAIFLFSGAGMLALTQGGASSGTVELSPYTVAFVAFVSGFMAEDAFAAIQKAGKNIFNAESEKAVAAGANGDAPLPPPSS